MRFRNSSQRKAVMAKYRELGFSSISAKFYTNKGIDPDSLKDKNFKQLAAKGIFLKYREDKDKDGVKNINDCKPLDSKRQGFMHDWTMKRLKKQEEQAEAKREKAQKKLSDLQDELKVKQRISQKSLDVKASETAAKEAIINQKREEEKKLDAIRVEEQMLKRKMDNYTFTGKAKKFLKHTGEVSKAEASKFGGEVKRRWNSEESRKNRAVTATYAKKGFKKLWKSIK